MAMGYEVKEPQFAKAAVSGVRPESPIESQISQLRSNVDLVHDMLNNLNHRLLPVLADLPQSNDAVAASPDEPACQIAKEIEQISQSALVAVMKARQMLESLQL